MTRSRGGQKCSRFHSDFSLSALTRPKTGSPLAPECTSHKASRELLPAYGSSSLTAPTHTTPFRSPRYSLLHSSILPRPGGRVKTEPASNHGNHHYPRNFPPNPLHFPSPSVKIVHGNIYAAGRKVFAPPCGPVRVNVALSTANNRAHRHYTRFGLRLQGRTRILLCACKKRR